MARAVKTEGHGVVRTACNLHCPDSCALDMDLSRDPPRIRAVPEHPFTQGLSCPKVRKHLQRIRSGNRITTPLLRHRGRWQPLSWDQALSLCAERITGWRDDDPASLLHVQGMGARGVTKAVVDHFFTAIGATKTFGSLCDETGIMASLLDFGDLDHNDITDLNRARVIVNWGRDLSRSSVHLARIVSLARKHGTRVVSIWPGGEGYAPFSDELIRIDPGQDRFLALAVIRLLMERSRLDPGKLKNVSGLSGFRGLLDRWTVQELAGMSGVAEDRMASLADIYAQGGVSTLLGWGMQRHVYGGENVRAVNALAWLSGNVGSKGTGVTFNISSARNLDLSWLQAGAWRKLCLPLLGQEIQTAARPGIRGAWINGTNVVNQAPDSRGLAETLSSLEFVVVVDGFMTDTARCADIILPCSLMFEEGEVFGSCTHDWVQIARPVFSPPGQSRSDLDIVRDLNVRLGSPVEIPSREMCFERSLDLDDQQRTMLWDRGYVHVRPGWVAFASGTAHPDSTFHLLQEVHQDPTPDEGFPLQLLSLVRRHTVHSQLGEDELDESLVLWVHPEAASLHGCPGGGQATAVSPLGRIQVELRLDHGLHPGVALCRRGGWMTGEANVNRIIEAKATDLGVGAAYYSQRIRIEGLGETPE